MTFSRLDQLLGFLKEDPNDPFTIYAIALEYSKSDEKKALEYYQQLLSEHSNYVATYYHAGKLLEKMGNKSEAERVYRKGIEVSRNAGKLHALAEIQSSLNQLMDLDEEED